MSSKGEHLTIGLAGLGTQGIGYARRFDQFNHTYVGADFDADARAEFATETGSDVIENPKKLLEYDLDGLIIALPPKFHEPIATSALESGVDVLIEKPVAHTLHSARQIERAASESDANAMVAFYTKFYKSTAILLGYVADGYFGDITHVDAVIERRRGLPGRGTWFTSQDIAGGGALIDIGIHALDVLMAIYEYSPVKWAWGQTTTQFGDKDDYLYLETASEHKNTDLFDVEDAASVVLEFDDGGTVNLRVAWATNNRERHEYRIHGTERGARLDLTQVYTATIGREDADIVKEEDINDREILELYDVRSIGENHFVDSRVVAKGVDAYEEMLSSFFDGIGSSTPYDKNPIRQGVQVQKVIDSIYRSAREGEPVQVDSFEDINRL
ncbi:Gfo/Idh/MocA family oxidoreductase [Halomontanus rarus]|uniref:Gfo/Idh/MocA family protein n=1 Tax=Halomontanus rarus TaxID=3034020 RepID=UPI00293BCC10|nr:Gfo/Idh/MocA family oxidoreductase [Halovivax sp. KZCA124]